MENVAQSSTGNVYGIYDLSGGAYEYVAAYHENGLEEYLINGNSFTNSTSNRYVTVYSGKDYINGDATNETNGWNNDGGTLLTTEVPFLGRGGDKGSDKNAGIFCFNASLGEKGNYKTFRICIIIK